MASSYRRGERAPKPLRVPLIVVAIGFLVYLFGNVINSANTAGFGLLFVVWGVLSASVLAISHWRRSRATHGTGARR